MLKFIIFKRTNQSLDALGGILSDNKCLYYSSKIKSGQYNKCMIFPNEYN